MGHYFDLVTSRKCAKQILSIMPMLEIDCPECGGVPTHLRVPDSEGTKPYCYNCKGTGKIKRSIFEAIDMEGKVVE